MLPLIRGSDDNGATKLVRGVSSNGILLANSRHGSSGRNLEKMEHFGKANFAARDARRIRQQYHLLHGPGVGPTDPGLAYRPAALRSASRATAACNGLASVSPMFISRLS